MTIQGRSPTTRLHSQREGCAQSFSLRKSGKRQQGRRRCQRGPTIPDTQGWEWPHATKEKASKLCCKHGEALPCKCCRRRLRAKNVQLKKKASSRRPVPQCSTSPQNDTEEPFESCFAERKLEIRTRAKSAHFVPSQSSSLEHIYEPLYVGIATLQQRRWNISSYLEKSRGAHTNYLIYRDSQVFGLNFVLECFDGSWRNISLINETVGKLMNTEVFSFSHSVPCLGVKCPESPGSVKAWETHIEHFVQSNEYRWVFDLAGHQVHFDWRISPRPTTTKRSF